MPRPWDGGNSPLREAGFRVPGGHGIKAGPVRATAFRESRVLRSIRLLLSLLALALAVAAPAAAGSLVAAPGGVALGGYDVTSYGEDGGPRHGQPQFSLKWQGVIWLFANRDSMLRFEADPRAFAPQFGGYCAAVLAEGRLSPGNPLVYAIRDGRLYMFRAEEGRQRWLSRPDAETERARAVWHHLREITRTPE